MNLSVKNANQTNIEDYIDLTDKKCDLANYAITSNNSKNNCTIHQITPTDRNTYRGFLLAKSSQGNAFTICDIDFLQPKADGKYPIRLTFRRTNKDLQDKRVSRNASYQRISFEGSQDGYVEFWKMIAFLEKFKELIDAGDFSNEFRVVSDDLIIDNINNKNIDETLSLIEQLNLSVEDITDAHNHKQRKESLQVFERLMENTEYREGYRSKHNIRKPGDEPIWQHFFMNNKWIFGLNLDLRFISDIIPEQHIGTTDTSGKGDPSVDFLGLDNFTTLIEIKTPETKFFNDNRGRTSRVGTWAFSSDFIDGISQCLAQKDKLLKKTGEIRYNDKIVGHSQKVTIDPRTIFVIGNKSKEIPNAGEDANDRDKHETLERFTRDSRNISIISFDELLERAERIVNYGGGVQKK